MRGETDDYLVTLQLEQVLAKPRVYGRLYLLQSKALCIPLASAFLGVPSMFINEGNISTAKNPVPP